MSGQRDQIDDLPPDDLDDMISAPDRSGAPTAGLIIENCSKCGGSGVWRGGYSTGACSACKGTGKQTFKRSGHAPKEPRGDTGVGGS